MFYIHFLGKTPAPVGILLAILLGIAFGATNGIIINVLRVNPFVATLGTSSIFIGLITIYAGANASFASSTSYLWLGNTKVLGIPLDGLFGLIIMLISGIVLWRSTFGRSVYALGGNREAARLSGLRVRWVSAATFILIGAMAAFVGGVCTASQLGTATPGLRRQHHAADDRGGDHRRDRADRRRGRDVALARRPGDPCSDHQSVHREEPQPEPPDRVRGRDRDPRRHHGRLDPTPPCLLTRG